MTFDKGLQLDKGRISRVTEYFAGFCEFRLYKSGMEIHDSLHPDDVKAVRLYSLVQTVIVQSKEEFHTLINKLRKLCAKKNGEDEIVAMLKGKKVVIEEFKYARDGVEVTVDFIIPPHRTTA